MTEAGLEPARPKAPQSECGVYAYFSTTRPDTNEAENEGIEPSGHVSDHQLSGLTWFANDHTLSNEG